MTEIDAWYMLYISGLRGCVAVLTNRRETREPERWIASDRFDPFDYYSRVLPSQPRLNRHYRTYPWLAWSRSFHVC